MNLRMCGSMVSTPHQIGEVGNIAERAPGGVPGRSGARPTASAGPVWPFRACAAAVILICLAGCAAFDRCGLRGCPGDADITAEVRALYTQYPALEATNSIDIQTTDRIVYLRGVVDTPFQQRFAEEVALKAKGVSRVVNLVGLSNSR